MIVKLEEQIPGIKPGWIVFNSFKRFILDFNTIQLFQTQDLPSFDNKIRVEKFQDPVRYLLNPRGYIPSTLPPRHQVENLSHQQITLTLTRNNSS